MRYINETLNNVNIAVSNRLKSGSGCFHYDETENTIYYYDTLKNKEEFELYCNEYDFKQSNKFEEWVFNRLSYSVQKITIEECKRELRKLFII